MLVVFCWLLWFCLSSKPREASAAAEAVAGSLYLSQLLSSTHCLHGLWPGFRLRGWQKLSVSCACGNEADPQGSWNKGWLSLLSHPFPLFFLYMKNLFIIFNPFWGGGGGRRCCIWLCSRIFKSLFVPLKVSWNGLSSCWNCKAFFFYSFFLKSSCLVIIVLSLVNW